MGMAARSAEDGKVWRRGSESTAGDGWCEEEEEEEEEERAHMRTSSKTGHWSGGGTSWASKGGGAAKSKGSMTEGNAMRPFWR